MDFFESIAQSFIKTFITDDRWLQLLSGLGVTIVITLVAAAIGIVLGFLIAMVRSTYDMQLKKMFEAFRLYPQGIELYL